MEYRITEKPAFSVVGKSIRVSIKDGENMRLIPQFWDTCLKDGTHDKLVSIGEKGVTLGNVTLGICKDFAEDMSTFTYLIAAENSGDGVPDSMEETAIPAAAWAVFEAKGTLPESIQNAWGQIWSEFFPTSPYKHGNGPDLELYPRGNPHYADYVCEIWIPVVKK